jgi:hypothetical protein
MRREKRGIGGRGGRGGKRGKEEEKRVVSQHQPGFLPLSPLQPLLPPPYTGTTEPSSMLK